MGQWFISLLTFSLQIFFFVPAFFPGLGCSDCAAATLNYRFSVLIFCSTWTDILINIVVILLTFPYNNNPVLHQNIPSGYSYQTLTPLPTSSCTNLNVDYLAFMPLCYSLTRRHKHNSHWLAGNSNIFFCPEVWGWQCHRLSTCQGKGTLKN